MIVVVLKAGIYAGPGWISLPFSEEGATVDIQESWYAQAMIDAGCVALPVVEPEPEIKEPEPVVFPVEPAVEETVKKKVAK